MQFTSCISWTQLLFFLWFIKLVASLSSALSFQQFLHVCLWEHTGLMAGWQPHFIMCALNAGDSTMWNTETPHPCTKPGWIILMKHQIIAFGNCSTRHLSASCAVLGFSPSPVTVLQTISRLTVEVCPHTGVCWPLSGHTKGSRLHAVARLWVTASRWRRAFWNIWAELNDRTRAQFWTFCRSEMSRIW